jgi:membrane protease YdiL (CAAX protease family)
VSTSHAQTPRVKPSIAAGFAVYAGYLAIFYATWVINDVDYDTIGETTESAKLHYAFPTLFGCAFLVVAITALGWWRLTLFDKQRSGPRWAWIGPIAMFLVAIASYATINPDGVTGSLVMWSVLGGIGVGFGEEMITRGAVLTGLRSEFSERKVWLYSTLAFSALHLPNVLFGLDPSGVVPQLLFTFVIGSLLYATRRLSGTLLVPMFLHGFWDTSVFLPHASDITKSPFPGVIIIAPFAIAAAWAVVRKNKDLRLG